MPRNRAGNDPMSIRCPVCGATEWDSDHADQYVILHRDCWLYLLEYADLPTDDDELYRELEDHRWEGVSFC